MSYTKKTWKNGEVIDSEQLNRMEEGIDEAHKKLLWENVSAASAFTAQDIVIPEGSYDAFEVVFLDSAENRFSVTQVLTPFANLSLNNGRALLRLSVFNLSEISYRDVVIGNNVISFDAGYVLTDNGEPIQSMYCVIPCKIYGIKGVH